MRDKDVTVDTFGILISGLLEAEREEEPVSERSRHASGVYALSTAAVAPPLECELPPEA